MKKNKNEDQSFILIILVIFILSVTSVLVETNKKPFYSQTQIEYVTE